MASRFQVGNLDVRGEDGGYQGWVPHMDTILTRLYRTTVTEIQEGRSQSKPPPAVLGQA